MSKLLAHQSCQAIGALTEVYRLGRHQNLHSRRNRDHVAAFTARSTAVSVAASFSAPDANHRGADHDLDDRVSDNLVRRDRRLQARQDFLDNDRNEGGSIPISRATFAAKSAHVVVVTSPREHPADGLPNDLGNAHAMILAQREKLAEKEAALSEAQSEAKVRALEIERLGFQLAKARREHLGQSSERSKLLVEQLELAIEDLEETQAQIRALDRTQPGLPLKKGRTGTMTHDYKQKGTTTLLAAMNGLDGTIIGCNTQRHRHRVNRFLNTTAIVSLCTSRPTYVISREPLGSPGPRPSCGTLMSAAQT